MRKLIIIATIFASTFCNGQAYRKCTVYQFSGEDSNSKHVALVQTFNQAGKIILEKYSDYKKSSDQGNIDGIYRYYYEHRLLTKRIFIPLNKDTSKVLYYYNSKKQCIREEHFTSERKLKKGVRKGWGQPDGCIIFDSDLEKNRTWSKVNQVAFSYDAKGRLIKKEDEHDYDRVWQYDSLNRITQEKGYSNGKLEYIQSNKYFSGGYSNSQIFFDINGQPKPASYSDMIFNPIFSSTYYLNAAGRIIKEEMTTEKAVKISEETTQYDSHGRVVKTIHRYLDNHYITKENEAKTTHIFQYE